jgi:hypothetical protein
VKAPSDEQTRAATAAVIAKAAGRRAELSIAFLEDADRLRRQLWEPCEVHAFGGRDNTFRTVTIPEAEPRAKVALMTAAGIAVDKHLALERHDASETESMAAVDLWLRFMKGGTE